MWLKRNNTGIYLVAFTLAHIGSNIDTGNLIYPPDAGNRTKTTCNLEKRSGIIFFKNEEHA